MSKIYDAIMKAQREQKVLEKEAISSRSVPEVQPVAPEREVDQKTPFLVTTTKRITRVNIGKFVAKPDSIMAEQFRKLRGIISTHNLTSSLRSLLVTSCMPAEGKTKVAINLSFTIAKGLDDSVILVDADLRRKSLSSLLDLRNASGLSDILVGRAGIQETLIPTEIKGLAVLPAGLNPPNPAELVASMRMRSLVQHLGAGYRNSYIIIDSTPIVSTAEANILTEVVDGVLIVILADKTRRDVVRRELKTINAEKILGVILNCAELETSDYDHEYYKSYAPRKSDEPT